MSTPRYYPRYHGKDGFEERYVVIDSSTGEEVSNPLPYHLANDQCAARNEGTYADSWAALAAMIMPARI